ncbi:MAG: CsbD family protein [Comamonas sp.]|uniref:CsbD family protein n=1 Tax=Comamonas TaxID=283 RepID=UPI000EADB604|nr:CsbD family protein [Comamonas sp. lk]
MKKEQITGRVDQAKGAIKEAAGKLTGNTKLEVEGKLEKATGKAEAKVADLANAAEKSFKK